jgi:hypothetical protein
MENWDSLEYSTVLHEGRETRTLPKETDPGVFVVFRDVANQYGGITKDKRREIWRDLTVVEIATNKDKRIVAAYEVEDSFFPQYYPQAWAGYQERKKQAEERNPVTKAEQIMLKEAGITSIEQVMAGDPKTPIGLNTLGDIQERLKEHGFDNSTNSTVRSGTRSSRNKNADVTDRK